MSDPETGGCVSCGMPMRSDADHALGDRSKDFCAHCSNGDGTMMRYEEVLTRMAEFLQTAQGLDEQVAHDAAKDMLAKMPAWQQR